jgi:RimJ/RimL family protein N-acetyltransferase
MKPSVQLRPVGSLTGGVTRWHVVAAETTVGWIGIVGRESSALVVGYEIGNEHRGRGYASAALRALCSQTRQPVIAETLADHTASRRVMENAGMRLMDVDGATVRYAYDVPSAP